MIQDKGKANCEKNTNYKISTNNSNLTEDNVISTFKYNTLYKLGIHQRNIQ